MLHLVLLVTRCAKQAMLHVNHLHHSCFFAAVLQARVPGRAHAAAVQQQRRGRRQAVAAG